MSIWDWIMIIGMPTLLLAMIIAVWYSKQVTRRLWFISNNLGNLLIETGYIKDHLAMVYGLDTYYGDETLEHLLSHIGGYLEIVERFEEIYSIVDGQLEITATEEEFIDEPEEEK